VKAIAEARNVPLLEPAGMVREAGTVRLVELEFEPRTVEVELRAVELALKAMVPPPDPLRITVQVLEALGANIPGLHAMELIELITAVLTVPPVPVTAIESPVGEAPMLLLIVIGRALLPDGVTDTVATTPLEMALEVNPHATHV
jgi:hypothetical protein